MEPTDNQNSDNSWSYNRDLLRILEQDRRRRQVAPEKDPFLENTPIFPKPYKTNKEDELSRRIKKVLRNVDPKFLFLVHDSPLIPLWIPKKPKIKSQTQSHRPASSKTNPYEDIWRESSPESLDLTPEQSYDACDTDLSKQRSEAKAPQSEILPEPVKKKKLIDVPSTGKTLKVVEKPSSSLASPRALQSQHKRMAPAQPSISESKSTRECHSSSVCDREISSSDSEDSLPRVLDLPASKPEPPAFNKWYLHNIVTQIKRGAVQREGLREITHGNGHEEGVKQEQGISSNSCQQHSKAREPSYKSCGQVAKDFHKTFAQVAEDTHKTSGQVTKALQESHVTSTHSSLKPLVHTKEALPRKIVGIKRPSEPLEHDKSKKVLKLESEPGHSQRSELEVRDQSFKDKLKVQEAEKPNPAFRKGVKLGVQKPSKNREDKDPDKSFVHMPKVPDQSCGQVAKPTHESDITSKPSFLKPPVNTKEALPKDTLGIKRPSMSQVHDESKRVWKIKNETGLLQVIDQSCKDQPKVTVKPKAIDKKDLKPALHKPSEKRKGSHQVNTTGFLEPRLLRHAQEYDALMPSGHRPGDLHKGKVPLPPGEKKLFPPAREVDMKRKAMRSPEESPRKKREDKGDTPRKKKE
ncbi:AF4/FMR2 family member 1-like isoform X2 [Vidua macroura]|uniref:AF4/FMR2 family member 1-like isoform X2 n=1 Tax=Vidua macroura TaxID=187451 RepID=UPI0023A85F65|nr:AF4/FMR2 family member 1-like isoform X2 [Vidua macroura]